MDYYYSPSSPPCQSVLILAKALGVKLNKITLNTSEREHLKPEFVKINPQHTIPTLVDDGFALWESRAILVYLAEKYGKDDSLFSKDPQQQALINQRLYFDEGVLYQSFREYYYPQFRSNAPADPEKLKKVEAAFGFLNTFLEGHQYVAGNKLTVADIAILTSVSTFEAVGFKVNNYSNVAKWYANAQKVTAAWVEDLQYLDALKKRIELMRSQNS